jgi:hypothetical protein
MYMNSDELISQGNDLRSQNKFDQALACYAQAVIQDPDCFAAFNNYGNVLRECGHIKQSIPFLQAACEMAPGNATAWFNLAVAYLALENYEKGWPLYESRWNYEHLDGQLPKFSQPRWAADDLQGKTILVVGEQGHGDVIQFSRFLPNLKQLGAKIRLVTNSNLLPLFKSSAILESVTTPEEPPGDFDYWTMIMSLPGHLQINAAQLPAPLQYIGANTETINLWRDRLGPKKRMRVGFAWSGRPDSWLNQHKRMPLPTMLELIQQCTDLDWISLQVESDDKETALLESAGVKLFPGTIRNWADTAGLVHHLDLVISVDTAAAHLAGAMGKPTWVPLNRYASCWRWGTLDRENMPWYPSMRVFRQAVHGDWTDPVQRIAKFIKLFKI